MRNGVKAPANLPGAHIVGADVARRRAFALTDAGALYQQILINGARARRQHVGFGDIAAESDAQIDRPRIAERGVRLPAGRVEGIEPPSSGEEDASLLPIGPEYDAAVYVCRAL